MRVALIVHSEACQPYHKGWRIIEADAGKSGIAMVKSDNPHLVILDLGLPDMDGVSVTKRLS